MSDNINFNKITGKHSFVSHKERPWHGLGTIVEDAMTSKEAIELAGLNYNVRKSPVYVKFPEQVIDSTGVRGKEVPDTFATYRDDTLDVFGTVGNRYEIVQNTEAFKFMDSIVGKGKAIYETAGALGNGEVVFITAKLPYYIKLNGNDVVNNYLVVSISHDATKSVNIFLTPIRVVCANTLALGINANKFMFKLRHTSNVHGKMQDASELLTISKTITEETQELYKHLINTKVTDKQVHEYFQQTIFTAEELISFNNEKVALKYSDVISTRKKNILTELVKYYEIGVGQDNILGTAFGAYNALTGYLSNIKKYSNDSKKMSSLVLGGSDAKLNNYALKLATNLI